MNIRTLQEELERERSVLKAAKDRIAIQNAELEKLRKESELHEKTEEALEDTNNRLTELISNIQSGVFAADENKNVIIVNETFCRQFSITVLPETLVGTSSTKVFEHIKHLF